MLSQEHKTDNKNSTNFQLSLTKQNHNEHKKTIINGSSIGNKNKDQVNHKDCFFNFKILEENKNQNLTDIKRTNNKNSIYNNNNNFNTIRNNTEIKNNNLDNDLTLLSKYKKCNTQEMLNQDTKIENNNFLLKKNDSVNDDKYFMWKKLPLEISINIFKYFSISEFAIIRQVSKYFDFVVTNPVFYINIDLTNNSDYATNDLLFFYWKYSNGYLLKLNLSQCNLITDEIFEKAVNFPCTDSIDEGKLKNLNINFEHLYLDNKNTNDEDENKSKIIETKEKSLLQNIQSLDLSYCNGIYSSYIMSNFFKGYSINPDNSIHKKIGCRNLKYLNLSDLYQILDDNLLLGISQGCPSLNSLYISKGYDITNFGVKVLLNRCKKLRVIQLINCPKINYKAFNNKLTNLLCDISNANDDECESIFDELNDGCFSDLNDSESECSDINLDSDFNTNTNIYQTNFEDENITKENSNSIQINEKYFSSNNDASLLQSYHQTSYNTNYGFLQLKHINLSNCRRLEDKFIRNIARVCPFLEELYISGCQNISDLGMTYLGRGIAWKTKKVKILDISGCYCISDDGIKALVPSVLEKMDISNCSFITDQGLQYILNGMPNLEEIRIENCSGTSAVGRETILTRYKIFSTIQ